MSFIALAIGGSALLGAGVAIYEGNQTQKAISSEQNLLNNLQYQPIDIAALQKQATAASIADATQSLQLQTQLQPDVVRSNQELQKSVADQLALGGQLPPDVADQIAQLGRTAGTGTGNTGNAAPITAALSGQSALSLLQSRQAAATQLAAANPSPTVGLSAQDIASAVEANSNATNQFNLAKAGGQASLINSGAQANAATAGGVGSSLSQALTLLALTQGKPAATNTLQPTPSLSGISTPGSGYAIPGGGALTPISTSGSVVGGLN